MTYRLANTLLSPNETMNETELSHYFAKSTSRSVIKSSSRAVSKNILILQKRSAHFHWFLWSICIHCSNWARSKGKIFFSYVPHLTKFCFVSTKEVSVTKAPQVKPSFKIHLSLSIIPLLVPVSWTCRQES